VTFLAAHRREFPFPIKGTLALHLPGCQTRFRVVPDVGSDHNKLAARGKKIQCHKFQGQEAAVCILSMCSSYGEYGSRGLAVHSRPFSNQRRHFPS
jgi:hypothetical protein